MKLTDDLNPYSGLLSGLFGSMSNATGSEIENSLHIAQLKAERISRDAAIVACSNASFYPKTSMPDITPIDNYFKGVGDVMFTDRNTNKNDNNMSEINYEYRKLLKTLIEKCSAFEKGKSSYDYSLRVSSSYKSGIKVFDDILYHYYKLNQYSYYGQFVLIKDKHKTNETDKYIITKGSGLIYDDKLINFENYSYCGQCLLTDDFYKLIDTYGYSFMESVVNDIINSEKKDTGLSETVQSEVDKIISKYK